MKSTLLRQGFLVAGGLVGNLDPPEHIFDSNPVCSDTLSIDFPYSDSISSLSLFNSKFPATSTINLHNQEPFDSDQQNIFATIITDTEPTSLPQDTICDSTFPFHSIPHTNISSTDEIFIPFDITDSIPTLHFPASDSGTCDPDALQINLATKKKYKPVALKVKPIIGELPAKFRIIRNITGDPLKDLPTLNPNPPPFTPTGRYTQERKELFDTAHQVSSYQQSATYSTTL